jgi:biofilm PGA synthesis N-glycosyltransferase PgaC
MSLQVLFSWLFRCFLGVFFAALTVVAFTYGTIPRLTSSGFLGMVNMGIISYLLLLAVRHFLMIFFAGLEKVKRDSTEMPTDFPPISILVPAFNEGTVIEHCIEELCKIDYPHYEILIIDDGSTDDTAFYARKAASERGNVRVLCKKNGGKASALNLGIEQAKFSYVFCIDADSLVAPAALKMGIRHLVANSSVGAVAGSVFVLNQHTALTKFQALEYLIGLNFFKSAQSYFGLVTIIPGPSGLFRKSTLQKLGGYAADTFAEDCDVTLRLLIAGHSVIFEPQMEVRTEAPQDLLSLIKQRYRWNRGILQALRKHYGALRHPVTQPVAWMLICYFFLESLLLPFLNIFLAALSLFYTAHTQDFSLFSMWLIQLTLLDLSTVLVSLSDLRWSTQLVFFAVVNRFSYAFFLEIIKLLSSCEEVLGIQMNWGKLHRIGEVKK